MYVTTKIDIMDNGKFITKGARGIVMAARWGDKGEWYVVTFPNHPMVLVLRDNLTITTEIKNVSKKQQTVEEEREECQSKWKKELSPPSTGDGGM